MSLGKTETAGGAPRSRDYFCGCAGRARPPRLCARRPPRGSSRINIVRIVLAILLPPVAAFLTVGLGLHFWLNLLLTIFFFVPGMIHALWLVVRRAERTSGPSLPNV